MRAYIISYFGHSDDMATKRREVHKRQLDWMKEKGFDIYVVNQEYQEDDYDSDVTYIGTNVKSSPVIARNIAFRHLYASDQDWAVFADNDAIVEVYNELDMFAVIDSNIQGLVNDKHTVISALNPRRYPFRNYDKTYAKDYISLEGINGFKESFFIMLNLKKHYDFELLIDEEFFNDNGQVLSGESFWMFAALLRAGLRSPVMCGQIIMKELDTKYSTWNHNKDSAAYVRSIDRIIEIYNRFNIRHEDLRKRKYVAIGYTIDQSDRVSYRKISTTKAKASMVRSSALKFKQSAFFDLPTPMTTEELIEYAHNHNDEVLSKFHVKNVGIRLDYKVQDILIRYATKQIQFDI